MQPDTAPTCRGSVGLRVDRLRTISLLWSGVVASFAGVCLASQLGGADPSTGPEYLIPAFSAAFVGATQFRHGRFNPWGAVVVAVLMIGTGSVGLLLLAGTQQWMPQVFQARCWIAAVGITMYQRKTTPRPAD